MKKQYHLFTLLIISTFIFQSCKEKEDPIPTEDAVVKCEKSKTQVYQDGQLSGYTEYRKDESENISYELTYDKRDQLTDSASHTYNSDNQKVRSYYFNRTNTFTQVQTWEYNDDKSIKRYQLSINGNVSRTENHTYNELGEVDSIFINASGVSSIQVIEYENGKPTKEMFVDASKKIYQTNIYTYSGNTSTIVKKDADGKLQSTTTIVHNDNDQETSWELKDKDGNITITRITEYDENGNVINVKDDYAGFGIYEYRSTWVCI